MEKIHSHVMDHLIRHTTQIPKGFLRYKTLELLGEKPMSGSEIAEEVQRRTAGQWKPGPGSIYPLLAWLQKNGYASEQPVENGMKRYALTKAGRQFLEEQKKLPVELEKKDRAMAFCLMDLLWLEGDDELAGELRRSIAGLVSALSEFNMIMGRGLSKDRVRNVKDAVDEATRKIETINKSLKVSDRR